MLTEEFVASIESEVVNLFTWRREYEEGWLMIHLVVTAIW